MTLRLGEWIGTIVMFGTSYEPAIDLSVVSHSVHRMRDGYKTLGLPNMIRPELVLRGPSVGG